MTRPDLDAIRARNMVDWTGNGKEELSGDVAALLAYIGELERDLRNERSAFESCNRARQHCEDECASLRARACITTDAGATQLIATLEHMLAEERENVDTLRARVAELEAEAATLRHRDALLKRVHGVLEDMCCRVPTSIDEPVDAIIRVSLSRANQRFVDEYDMRVSAQEWANELRAELFDWQHAVEYILGDNWTSADGHDAKAARKALAEWAEKAQGEATRLRVEVDELRRQRDTFFDLYRRQMADDAAQMREHGLSYDGIRKVVNEYIDEELSFGKLVELLRAAARELAKEEVAELKARITTMEAMKP